jgi:hypothetical protein
MMKTVLAFLLLISLTLFTACAPAPPAPSENRPDDFRILYQWWAGSMPPPYYYEYRLEVDPTGAAWIILTPDYPASQVPSYTENFSLSEQQLEDLYQEMVELGLFRLNWQAEDSPPVGGSTSLLTVTAGGREIRILSYTIERQRQQAERMADTVRGTVPQEVWDRLEEKRQEYMEENG